MRPGAGEAARNTLSVKCALLAVAVALAQDRSGLCAGPGPDGLFGTADDVLVATGETLAQVQTRVLGSAASAPLFTRIPGYGLLNLRGGCRFGERSDLFVDFPNIGDKSYRGLHWGLDGPGRSLTMSYRYRF